MTIAEMELIFPDNNNGEITAYGLRLYANYVLTKLGSIDTDISILQTGLSTANAAIANFEQPGLSKITENTKTGYRLANEDPANHGNIGQNAVDLSTSDKAGEYYGATGDNSFTSGYLTSAGGSYSVAQGYMTKSGSAFPDSVLDVLKQVDIPLDTRVATKFTTGVGFSSQVITLNPTETIYFGMATGQEPAANASDSKIYLFDVTGGLDIQNDALADIASADNDYSGAGVYWSEAGSYTNNTGTAMDVQVVYSACCSLTFSVDFVTPGADVWLYVSKTTDAVGLNLPDTVIEYDPAYGPAKPTYDFTHAEGISTSAEAEGAHAEGLETIAGGKYSHSEGYLTTTAKSSENIITASDGVLWDYFGLVHDSNDTKIVVGAKNHNDTGAAYIYNIDGTGEIKIVGSDSAAGDKFGDSVAINSTKILVGAPSNGATDLGAVYLYNLDGTGELKITPSWSQQNLYFGSSVALTETKIIVSAPFDNQSGLNVSGAIYIYNLDGTGEIKVTAGTPIANSYFGYDVDATATHIVVGARTENTKGAAYIYNIDGTGEVRVEGSDLGAYDYFGTSVAINSTKVLIGATFRDYNGVTNSGSAYMYNLDGTGELIIRPETNVSTIFGISVALTETKAIIGATGDHSAGTYSGAVYLYDLDGTNTFRVIPDGIFKDYYFGGSVSINASHLIVGADGENSAGKIHTYELSNLYNGIFTNAKGIGTIAQNTGMLAAGRYNVGTSGSTIVEIGVGGSDTTRANALEVYTDGTVTTPEATLTVIEARGLKTLVTKEYVDITVGNSGTGLESISDDGINTGWRLISRSPLNYGNIGQDATDVSTSDGWGVGATGNYSFAEGLNTNAEGTSAHAEGERTFASANAAHAEGYWTAAYADYSHAEGNETYVGSLAIGAHAEGSYTRAINPNQHVAGIFNTGTSPDTIHETGIGTDGVNRKNAFEIYTDGTATLPEATPAEIEARGITAIPTVEFLGGYIKSDITQAGAGSIAINNIVKITQADYNLLTTPDVNTFYIII